MFDYQRVNGSPTVPQVGHVCIVHRTPGTVVEQPTGLRSRAMGRLLETVAWRQGISGGSFRCETWAAEKISFSRQVEV